MYPVELYDERSNWSSLFKPKSILIPVLKDLLYPYFVYTNIWESIKLITLLAFSLDSPYSKGPGPLYFPDAISERPDSIVLHLSFSAYNAIIVFALSNLWDLIFSNLNSWL